MSTSRLARVRAPLLSSVGLLAAVGCAPPPPAVPTLAPPQSVVLPPPAPPSPAPAPAAAATTTAPETELEGAALTGDADASGGDAFGAGGLGLSGGGRGDQTGGLGRLGSRGFGSGAGLGDPLGSTPSLRQGATQVVGRLPPEVIQRVVRQNFGRFRRCFEATLRAAGPDAHGRVSVRFVIGPTGAVKSAAPVSTDLPDATLLKCVGAAFSALTFPHPDGGGEVTVVYPIVFASEPNTPPAPAPAKPASAPKK